MRYMLVSVPEENARMLREVVETSHLDAQVVMGQPVDVTTPGPWERPTDSQIARGQQMWDSDAKSTAWDDLPEQTKYEFVHEFISPEDEAVIMNILAEVGIIDDDDDDDDN